MVSVNIVVLTLIWVRWGGNYPPCLKLVRIMVENLVPENIPFSAKELLIFLMSEFFCKKSAFFGQNSTFTQSNSVRPVLEIF